MRVFLPWLLTIVVLIILLLSALPAVALDPPRWSKVEVVSSETDAKGVGLCIDGKDRLNIVWTEGDGPYDIHFKRYDNNLETINGKKKIGTTNTDSWLDCAADSANDIHVLFTDRGSLRYIKLSFSGIKLSGPDTVVNGNDIEDVSFHVDGDDELHIVYGNNGGVYYTRLTDRGETIKGPTEIASSGSQPDLWVDGNEMFVSLVDTTSNEIVLLTFDSNLKQKARVNISGGEGTVQYPKLVVDSHGNRMMFWNQFGNGAGRLLITQVNKDNRVVILDREIAGNVVVEKPVAARLDDDDHVHLVWYSREGNIKLNYCRVTINGEFLIAPLWVEDSLTTPASGTSGYSLKTDEEGIVHIAWVKVGVRYIDTLSRSGDDTGPLITKELNLLLLVISIALVFIVNTFILGRRKDDGKRFKASHENAKASKK